MRTPHTYVAQVLCTSLCRRDSPDNFILYRKHLCINHQTTSSKDTVNGTLKPEIQQ